MNKIIPIFVAAEQHYHGLHLLSHGDSFYGDHKTYKKMYSLYRQYFDEMSETMIAMYGPVKYNVADVSESAAMIVRKWSNLDTMPKKAIIPLTEILQAVNAALIEFPKDSLLWVGVNDFLSSVARVQNSYLFQLQQRFN